MLLGGVESSHPVGYPATLGRRIVTLVGAGDELHQKFSELIVFLRIADRFLPYREGTLASDGLASLITPKSVSYLRLHIPSFGGTCWVSFHGVL